MCGDGSEALFVQDVQTGRIFFACPACGIGWAEPPVAGQVDSIDPIRKLAPRGIRIPSLELIKAVGLEHLIARQVEDTWLELLADHGLEAAE